MPLRKKSSCEVGDREGVPTCCMSLDSRIDNSVSRFFDQNPFMAVDHVQRLPEKQPLLYAGQSR